MPASGSVRNNAWIGAGTAIAIVILLALELTAFSNNVSQSRSNSQTSSTQEAINEVSATYARHLLNVTSLNVPAIVSGYVKRHDTLDWKTGGFI